MQGVTVVDHPLVQHKLTLMRDKKRSTKGFRQLLNEIGMLLCYEVTRDLPLETDRDRDAADRRCSAPQIAGKKLVFAPILRAGVGFLDGMLTLVPSARVAHIGLYRDPESLQAVEYYFKAPSDLADRMILVLDPDARDRQLGRRGDRPAEGARRQGPALRLPARRARGHREVPRRRIRTCRSGPPPSTSASTITAISCRASATPATACTERADRQGLSWRPATGFDHIALHRRRLGNDPLPRLSRRERDHPRPGVVGRGRVGPAQGRASRTSSCASAAPG